MLGAYKQTKTMEGNGQRFLSSEKRASIPRFKESGKIIPAFDLQESSKGSQIRYLIVRARFLFAGMNYKMLPLTIFDT